RGEVSDTSSGDTSSGSQGHRVPRAQAKASGSESCARPPDEMAVLGGRPTDGRTRPCRPQESAAKFRPQRDGRGRGAAVEVSDISSGRRGGGGRGVRHLVWDISSGRGHGGRKGR